MRPTSVLILDSHRAVGAALAAVLCTEPDLSVVEVVGSADAAEAVLAAHDVDLLLLDPQLSRGDGLEFIRRVRTRYGRLRIVVVTDTQDPVFALGAVRAGVSSWVPKNRGIADLLLAIRGACAGESSFPPTLLRRILTMLTEPSGPPPSTGGETIANLTAREREILLYMVDGLDRQTIANRLFVSTHTVRTHIQNLLGKLSVHSGVEAVAVAVRSGLPHPDTHPTGGRG
jgi:DNA-binding NarL/FixJ family response regulator